MAEKSVIDWIAYVLVIIGAINWGLVGLNSFSAISYNWDLVGLLFSSMPWLGAVVYLLVGLSGIWIIFSLNKK